MASEVSSVAVRTAARAAAAPVSGAVSVAVVRLLSRIRASAVAGGRRRVRSRLTAVVVDQVATDLLQPLAAAEAGSVAMTSHRPAAAV